MKYFVAAALLSLGACSGDSEEQSAPLQPDAPLEIVITQFPKSYMGKWGMTARDCVPGSSDAKGLISVQGSLVKFYESVGTMRNGKRKTLTSLSTDLDMVGEGQEWQARNMFQLTGDRSGLTRTDTTTGEQFVYTRCAT